MNSLYISITSESIGLQSEKREGRGEVAVATSTRPEGFAACKVGLAAWMDGI